MPWYDYRCNECGEVFEVKRSFARSGEPASCPTCYSRVTQKLLATTYVLGLQSTAESMPVPMARKGGGGCGCGACSCNV